MSGNACFNKHEKKGKDILNRSNTLDYQAVLLVHLISPGPISFGASIIPINNLIISKAIESAGVLVH